MKLHDRTYTGINIQYPISKMIISGRKTVETRTYPIPEKLVGVPLLIIETPGKQATFKARIIGIIVFESSFKYSSKQEFYEDHFRHKVSPNSPWKWTKKGKWGWTIRSVKKLAKPLPAPKKKGIVYTHAIKLDNC